MSVSADLQASARATYRLILRTATSTFKGDPRVLNAFREKVRAETREGRSLTDPHAYAARVQYGREVADVLRRNIVQAQRAKNLQKDDVWQIRLNKDTELGLNDTIKERKSMPKGAGKCCSSAEIVTSEPEPSSILSSSNGIHQHTPRRLNYSALKRASQERLKPELDENDLEESFVRGSGPGGQSINKTSNNVQLLHKPTGIRVTCQETRSLQTNRMIARRNLIERLDQITNPGLSKENLKRAKQVERERRRRKKAKKRVRSNSDVADGK